MSRIIETYLAAQKLNFINTWLPKPQHNQFHNNKKWNNTSHKNIYWLCFTMIDFFTIKLLSLIAYLNAKWKKNYFKDK